MGGGGLRVHCISGCMGEGWGYDTMMLSQNNSRNLLKISYRIVNFTRIMQKNNMKGYSTALAEK